MSGTRLTADVDPSDPSNFPDFFAKVERPLYIVDRSLNQRFGEA